eukprot:Hpha_TRINITY_DN34087_c0_g1::TRINITY_DN34087_c0_g1_i1::g.30560::m.30560/K10630/RBCK1, HOIL1; RanBP-type and C3HC4-type zinc finger-containing protein 1
MTSPRGGPVWVCSSCTLHNDHDKMACEACGHEPRLLGRSNSSQSTQLAEVANTTREAARSALDAAGGDMARAAELLFDPVPAGPPSGTMELMQLAGGRITPEEAGRLLEEAGGDMRLARERVLVEFLQVGDCDLNCTRGPVQLNVAPFDCPICQCPVEVGEGMRLRTCLHEFCSDCARMHVEEKVQAGHSGLVTCPQPGCNSQFSHRELTALTGTANVTALDRRALDLEAARNAAMHHCPTPDCGYIVHWAGPEDGPPKLQCPKCRKSTCLSCKACPFHEGRTCQEHAHRKKDKADQRVSEAAILSGGGRQCKRCKLFVQKDAGCNKMMCLCGFRFCYECGSENAQCGCTPSSHGFWDNRQHKADFSKLHQKSSGT